MKRFLLISMLVMCLLFSGASFAGDSEDVKYRVEVKIIYNAVDVKEMSKLVRDIGEYHAGACEVKFDIKKVDDNFNGIVLYSGVLND